MNEYSQVVKDRLKSLNMNPSDLSKKIDITPQHAYNLINGTRRWNETLQNKVNEVLGIIPAYKFKKLKKGA